MNSRVHNILEHMLEDAQDAIQYATPDDLIAIASAREEYRRGETVRHDDIDWS